MSEKVSYLILVRHGESRWNLDNKFTGWVDVPLSEVGIQEALIAAQKLKGLNMDVAFTSKLARAQETLLLVLSEQEKTGVFLHESRPRKDWSRHHHGKLVDTGEIPVYSSEKLNERYYGALQGMNKDEARKKFGEEKVFEWRRSYDVRPPRGESLKDVYKRAVPYFKNHVIPLLKEGKNVLVVAHGNSLRAIIKHLDHVDDKDIPHLELELGKPIVYKYLHGLLVKENHIHSFNRPTQWQPNKRHHHYQSGVTAKLSKEVAIAEEPEEESKKKVVTKRNAPKKTSTKKVVAKKRSAVKKKVVAKKKPLVVKKKEVNKSPKTASKKALKKTSTKKRAVKKARPVKGAVKKTVSKTVKKATRQATPKKGPVIKTAKKTVKKTVKKKTAATKKRSDKKPVKKTKTAKRSAAKKSTKTASKKVPKKALKKNSSKRKALKKKAVRRKVDA